MGLSLGGIVASAGFVYLVCESHPFSSHQVGNCGRGRLMKWVVYFADVVPLWVTWFSAAFQL